MKTLSEEEKLQLANALQGVDSIEDLYDVLSTLSVSIECELLTKYNLAVDAVAYYIFGDTKNKGNLIYQMLNNTMYPGNGARLQDDSLLSAIMLDYEYSWRENFDDIEDALGNMLLKNGDEAKYWY